MLTEENPGISILRWKCLGFLIVWRTPSDILYYNEKGKADRLSLLIGREAARRKLPLRAPFVACALTVFTRKQPSIINHYICLYELSV